MFKKISIIIFIIILIFITYCFYPILTYKEDLENTPWRILLYDRNGVLITDKARESWYKEEDINYKLDSELIKSIIKIEDKNYFNHYWVDIVSKIRALKDNISSLKIVSGWSTITEQYIKNKYFKKEKRSFLQKLREAFLSVYFSFKEDKKNILNEYLNNIYLWNNIYWLKWALNIYFNKSDLDKLTKEELVIIISLIHNPWIKSLEEKNFKTYVEKIKNKLWFEFKRSIFKLKIKENINKFPFVTNESIKTSLNKPLHKTSPQPSPLEERGQEKFSFHSPSKERGWGGEVSIDSKLQEFAWEILNKTLDELSSRNVTNWAIFAINPKTKEVLIYMWSRDFYSKEIDWQVDVIKKERQPGSTMKPFLYLLALESWANPDDLVVDLESEYNSFQKWKTYISTNYSLNEFWLVRFKKALWNSLNNASVRLARELWLQKVYNFYKEYWFDLKQYPEYYGYSLVLWNPSITLESLVYSYINLLPENQEKNSPSFVDKWGEENINKFLLYDILSDPDNRDLSFWVNSILNTSIYQAVKTGTSSDFRDNLIVSYHPDLVLGVWVGNNDNSSMIWVTWITWAWYIWHQVIEKAIELWYIKDRKIMPPKWVIEWEYCLDNSCFRKELVYKKDTKEYFSRLAEKKYSSRDLFLKLTSEEEKRLKDFWMYISE